MYQQRLKKGINRGVHPNKKLTNWSKGPDRIASKESWPIQLDVTETDENTVERITKKNYLGLVTTEQEQNQVEALVHNIS